MMGFGFELYAWALFQQWAAETHQRLEAETPYDRAMDQLSQHYEDMRFIGKDTD